MKLLFCDLKTTYRFLLVLFVVTCGALAAFVEIDFHDSYLAIAMARQLIDSGFDSLSTIELWDPGRPRTMVGMIAVFSWVCRLWFGTYPSIEILHGGMVLVTTLWIVSWSRLVSKLFTPNHGALVGLLLLVQQIHFHYAATMNTDLLAGLCLVGAYHLFYDGWTGLYQEKDIRRWVGESILLGVVLALVGLSKNNLVFIFFQFFFFFGVSMWCFCPFSNQAELRKKFLVWMGMVGAVWFVVSDGLCRLISLNHKGFIAHLHWLFVVQRQELMIHAQNTAARPWTYVEGYYAIFGALFWAVVLLCFLHWALKQRKRVDLKRKGTWKFKASSQMAAFMVLKALFFLGVLQGIGHKEVRYLIPLIPPILMLIAWLFIYTFETLKKSYQPLFVILCGLALVWPLYRSVGDVRMYLTQSLYQSRSSGLSEAFWSSLRKDHPHFEDCSRIKACRFALWAPSPFDLKDLYYRRYDIWEPNINLLTSTASTTFDCLFFEQASDKAIVEKYLKPQLEAQECYIVKRHDPLSRQNELRVFRKKRRQASLPLDSLNPDPPPTFCLQSHTRASSCYEAVSMGPRFGFSNPWLE